MATAGDGAGAVGGLELALGDPRICRVRHHVSGRQLAPAPRVGVVVHGRVVRGPILLQVRIATSLHSSDEDGGLEVQPLEHESRDPERRSRAAARRQATAVHRERLGACSSGPSSECTRLGDRGRPSGPGRARVPEERGPLPRLERDVQSARPRLLHRPRLHAPLHALVGRHRSRGRPGLRAGGGGLPHGRAHPRGARRPRPRWPEPPLPGRPLGAPPRPRLLRPRRGLCRRAAAVAPRRGGRHLQQSQRRTLGNAFDPRDDLAAWGPPRCLGT
mmetsp:Transcript_24564/g.82232  ORF Transcript_24564/g.82232 Transcript_24564/m.82232 type:complete len:274 (-) Transcript_24564:796-1617(-)